MIINLINSDFLSFDGVFKYTAVNAALKKKKETPDTL